MLDGERVEAVGVARQKARGVRWLGPPTEVDVAVDIPAVAEALEPGHVARTEGVDVLQQSPAAVQHRQGPLVVRRDRVLARRHPR